MGQSVCRALTADSTASTTYKGQEGGPRYGVPPLNTRLLYLLIAFSQLKGLTESWPLSK